jgi:predicted ATPase
MSQVDEYGAAWGGKSPHERSHGEAFMTLLTQRLDGAGLYLFDEPEAALSPKRQMAALVRIHDLVVMHSQFIIATHSPILLSYPHATIYECGDHGIRPITYEETEVFRTTRDFITRHQKMVQMLLEDREEDQADQ